MATSKRKTTGAKKRRNSVNPVNPHRQHAPRKTSLTRSRRNPARRRHHRRHRNPLTGGIVMTGLRLAGAGAVIGLAQPMVRSFVAPYVGATPIASAGITLGTAWLVSKATSFIPFLKKYENDFLIAGATIAGAQLISAYVSPYLSRVVPTMSAPRYRRAGLGQDGAWRGRPWRGQNGIAVVTNQPPLHVLPPPSRQAAANGQAANGMQGMGMRPGAYRR